MLTRRLACIGLLLCASYATTAFAATTNKIEWHKDFKKAQQLAEKTGKPMLLDFVADWCKPCKEMEKDFWPQPLVVELTKHFVPISVDFDRGGPEISKYGVTSIPAVVVTDPWGNLVTRRHGYSPAIATLIIQTMQAVPTDFSPITEWNRLLEQDKGNLAALLGVGEFYQKHGILTLSNVYFKRALRSKEMATNVNSRGGLLITMGINFLKLMEYDEARKTFETYLKDFPKGDQGDTALLGILTAHLNKKKISDAEKTLSLLKANYPDSPKVRQGEQLFQQAGRLKN
jgi:thiol-disulfide isomerase/thioredoxin